MSRDYHIPVLSAQVVNLLVTDPDGIYVDCTVGGGGHSKLILQHLSENGRLIACDCDLEAIAESQTVLPPTTLFLHTRFSGIATQLGDLSTNGTTGILMDLGISSHQIDESERGFSHRFDAPLDLRMNPTAGESAAELLARIDLPELIRLIEDFGEDPQARRIAKAVIKQRDREPIRTTFQLAEAIGDAVPATRTKSLARVFQALRIAVNGELDEIAAALPDLWNTLRIGGRLAVISYHSLEDRITKDFMKSKSSIEYNPRTTPFAVQQTPSGRLLTRKPLTPDADEIAQNPRSRSAKLRVIERLA